VREAGRRAHTGTDRHRHRPGRFARTTPRALFVHPEAANALSLPTWAVHTSSVFEWGLAMRLIWQYAEVTGNERWKGMSWGMLPCLGSAMCACTWHFFYNATELEFLVALQAFLTVVGNFTCWIAAYRLCAPDGAVSDGPAGDEREGRVETE